MPPSGAYVVTADEVGNSATRNSRQGRVGRLLGDLLGTLALGRYYDGWPVMVGYVLNIHAHARVCRTT